VVLGGVADARDCVFNWDEASADSTPEGMSFFGELPRVDVLGVGETPVLGTASNPEKTRRSDQDYRNDWIDQVERVDEVRQIRGIRSNQDDRD